MFERFFSQPPKEESPQATEDRLARERQKRADEQLAAAAQSESVEQVPEMTLEEAHAAAGGSEKYGILAAWVGAAEDTPPAELIALAEVKQSTLSSEDEYSPGHDEPQAIMETLRMARNQSQHRKAA